YRPGTLILETTFENASGAVTLIDFMPPRDGTPNVVRIIVGQRGSMTMHMELVLRPDYGSVVPWVTRSEDDNTLRAIAGPDLFVLKTPVPTRGKNLRTIANFTL